MRYGIAGEAMVTAVTKTMLGETEARDLKLTLTVVVPGRSPYRATTRKAYGLSIIDRGAWCCRSGSTRPDRRKSSSQATRSTGSWSSCQLTAFLTSSAMAFSALSLSSVTAYEVGQMPLSSSRLASGVNPKVE